MKHSNAIKTIAACARPYWAAALFIAFSMPAAAHVTLEYQVANAGSYYKGSFKVGHGCGNSPVKQIVVTIPAGVQGAKPMPKAGWTLEVTREKLAHPRDDHGRTITEDVSRISWTAKTPADYLQNDWYDEFVLQAKLPAQAGMLYWPVSQVCETGKVDWVEVPKPGQKMSDLKNPAAALELMPAGGGEHNH
jgi:periplasmic copper chaperone A